MARSGPSEFWFLGGILAVPTAKSGRMELATSTPKKKPGILRGGKPRWGLQTHLVPGFWSDLVARSGDPKNRFLGGEIEFFGVFSQATGERPRLFFALNFYGYPGYPSKK